MSDVRRRALDTLVATELPWLRLRDHFVATVGPSSGTGQAFGPLRVLADATFAPRSRFPLHSHRDMEILSIVVQGELSHYGDQEHGATLRAREAQLISARDGMLHAEGNDTDAETRMLQIWFTPDTQGGAAAYFQRKLDEQPGGRQIVAGDEAMPLRSTTRVWWLDLVPGREQELELPAGFAGYLLAVTGAVTLSGNVTLATGEGAELRGTGVAVTCDADSAGALWIELPR